MRVLFFLLAAVACAAQPSLRLDPALATDCNANGQATVNLIWSARQTAQIRIAVGDAPVQMTGDLPPAGSVRSGPWVTDGMTFLLTDSAGAELARARARVVCVAARPDALLPLRVGYEWTYRTRNRQSTGETTTLRVTQVEEAGGEAWFEIRRDGGSLYGWFRNDEGGRVWRRERLEGPASLWGGAAAGSAPLPRQPYATPLGELETVEAVQAEALNRTRRLLAPGVGLVYLESFLLTGSSGGLLEAWDLVAYRQGALAREEAAESQLELAVESRQLDVSGGQVSNCAVGCYFVACGLAGADPPGTYKPCFRAQASGRSATPGATLELRLLDAAGAVLYQVSQPLAVGSRLQRQIPIQRPPGRYTLEGRVVSGGQAEHSSSLGLVVR